MNKICKSVKTVIPLIFMLFAAKTVFSAEVIGIAEIKTISEEKVLDYESKISSIIGSITVDGCIAFKKLPSEKIGQVQSALDAERAGALYNLRFIIYGYMQKSENMILCNLRLYDTQNHNIAFEVYATDDAAHSERLEKDIQQKLQSAFEELIGISQLKNKIKNPEAPSVNIGLFGDYWNPICNPWIENCMGIAGGGLFIDFFVPLPKKINSYPVAGISFRTKAAANYAKGYKNPYVSDYLIIKGGVDLLSNLFFSSYFSIYGGGGITYAYERLSYQKKYEEMQVESQNSLWVSGTVGCKINFNSVLSAFSATEINTRLSSENFMYVEQQLGLTLSIKSKRRAK